VDAGNAVCFAAGSGSYCSRRMLVVEGIAAAVVEEAARHHVPVCETVEEGQKEAGSQAAAEGRERYTVAAAKVVKETETAV
jgi:hypothetical protein